MTVAVTPKLTLEGNCDLSSTPASCACCTCKYIDLQCAQSNNHGQLGGGGGVLSISVIACMGSFHSMTNWLEQYDRFTFAIACL